MKIYKLPLLAEASPEGVYFLGPEEIKSDAVYLLYGRLHPNESGRAVTPKDGCEEIVYLIKGSIRVRCGKNVFSISAGEAFHATGAYYLDNHGEDEAVYIAAGGSANQRVKENLAQKPAAPQTRKQDECEPAADVTSENDFIITREDTSEEV